LTPLILHIDILSDHQHTQNEKRFITSSMLKKCMQLSHRQIDFDAYVDIARFQIKAFVE
jgi:hypothetical protein